MRGKLIIIEAGDGCGKATQTKALYEYLLAQGKRVHQVSFPDYESESSALVKMYLGGRFGSRAEDVNAYAASVFYAVDRYASFQTKWRQWYEDGAIIIADRYTTSNMVHQAVKFDSEREREAYLNWLYDLEFVKMGLPEPDAVLFLDMPPQLSARLIQQRAEAAHAVKDLHERDDAYLQRCHAAYAALAQKYGWHVIACAEDMELKTIAAIQREICLVVQPYI